MARVSWRLVAEVDANPDDVYAWLTDYREDDHTSEAFLRGSRAKPGSGHARREIVSRTDEEVHLRDAWGRNRFEARVRLHDEERAVHVQGDHGYRATWTAEPTDDGRTRVVNEGEMAARGLFGLMMRLFQGRMIDQIERDFNGHVEEIKVDVGRRP